MTSLFELIKDLSKEEVRHYKIFTGRIETREERKDIRLFDLIRTKGYKDEDEKLVKKLYPDGNKNAFYRLKGRLIKEIEQSMVVLYDNLDEKIKIINTISLANIYTYKSKYQKAIELLYRAEKTASEYKYYDLLDIIYGHIMDISKRIENLNSIEIIKKRKENDEHYQIIKQSQYIILSIRYQLKKTNFSSRDASVTNILQKLLDDLHVQNEIYKLPQVQYQIYTCVSELLLEKKDFKQLEEYLLKTYSEFEASGYFNVSNHEQKLTMIGWMINTLFKNRKFKDSLIFAEKLHDELETFNKLLYKKYLFIYHNGLIINYACLNRLTDAIELLEQLKEDPHYKGISFYDMFLYLNLSVLYFSMKNNSKSIKNLSIILTKEIYDKLSPQIKLMVSIIEIIIHYDMQNTEYVIHRLGEIKRIFREILKQPEYSREKNFINIISQVLKEESPFRKEHIKKLVQEFTGKNPRIEPGSNEGINYDAWFLSKINGRSYYENLLELLK